MDVVLHSLVFVFCAIAAVVNADECLSRPKPSENCALPPEQHKYDSCVLQTTEVEGLESKEWCVCSIGEEARVYFEEKGLCGDLTMSGLFTYDRKLYPVEGADPYETRRRVDRNACVLSCIESFECHCFQYSGTCQLFGPGCRLRRHGDGRWTTGYGPGYVLGREGHLSREVGNCASHCPLPILTRSAPRPGSLASKFGDDQLLNTEELLEILNKAFKKNLPADKMFSVHDARSLIAIWDDSRIGKLNLEQTEELLLKMQGYHTVFIKHDLDRSKSLDLKELRLALRDFNMTFTGDMVKKLLVRYWDEDTIELGLTFNSFARMVAKLGKIIENFKAKDEKKDGRVEHNMEEFLLTTMFY